MLAIIILTVTDIVLNHIVQIFNASSLSSGFLVFILLYS